MNMSLRYPNITGRTEREQLAQVNSYLRQMVDQLNFALQGQGGTGQAGADGKDGKKGKNGADGKTPQKGVDYWTDEDVKQIVDAAVEGVLKEKVKILEASMPVGYLYASDSPTEPKTLFGFGTWERVEDCFILAAGSTYAAGSTGGATEHRHTAQDMRAMIGAASGDASSINYVATSAYDPNTGAQTTGTYAINGSGSSGRGFSHYTPVVGYTTLDTNMPPYYAMYMWIRTA